jgi:hypothetical protein
MKFLGDGLRAGVLRVLGVAAAVAVLASCGGGQQAERFVPTRVIAFGDENSVINGDGSKYTVNAFVDDTVTPLVPDCTKNPIWVQYLAIAYGLSFPGCPGTSTTQLSQIAAQPGAKVADVVTQITNFRSGDGFSGNDLVTILAGQNDILEQYQLVKSGSQTEAQASAVLAAAGSALAGQVNVVALAGGKVLISTVPDLGFTPFAVNEGVANAGLLTRLTASLNTPLRLGIINDGHMIGLLLTDEMVQGIVKAVQAGSTLSYVDVTHVACDSSLDPDPLIALKKCTTLTLVDYTGVAGTVGTKANAATWLWADATHLSAGGQLSLGAQAYGRASGNPF